MNFLDNLISSKLLITAEDLEFVRAAIIGVVPDVLQALGTLVLAFLIYKLTAWPLRKLLIKREVEEWLARIIANNVYKFLVIVVALITALGQLGIHVGTAIAGIGVAGLALGFIAQDSLANIVAGFLISIDRPFRVGDYITLDKYYGRIELITMRSTRIRTQDNTYVVIPNQKLINDIIVDHTAGGNTRVSIPVSIIYEASIEDARQAILKEVRKIDDVLEAPAPDVVVEKLGDSGVELLVRVWIHDNARERRTYFKTVEVTHRALGYANIEIAYPHLELVKKGT